MPTSFGNGQAVVYIYSIVTVIVPGFLEGSTSMMHTSMTIGVSVGLVSAPVQKEKTGK